MTVHIEGDEGQDEWVIRSAPQCLTDILVQVARCDAEDEALFTFHIGEFIRSEIDDDCGLDGSYQADPLKRAALTRWATILETHAQLIRAALATPPE